MSAPSANGSGTSSLFSCIRAKDVHNYWQHPDHEPNTKNKNARAIEEEGPAGIVLGARVAGDWTSALNAYAKVREDRIRTSSPSPSPSPSSSSVPATSPTPINDRPIPVPVQVMFDGPYGGCGLDLETYNRVLLVAGGSGATFAIGLLDEVVAACVKNSRGDNGGKVKTNRVDLVWCIRSFGTFSNIYLCYLMLTMETNRFDCVVRTPPLRYRTCSSWGGSAADPGFCDMFLRVRSCPGYTWDRSAGGCEAQYGYAAGTYHGS